MNEAHAEAAKTISMTGIITTLVTAVLAGNVGGLGESLNTFLVNLAGQNPKLFWTIAGVLLFLVWNANALRKTYPDTATRPRWITYLMYLMPTSPPPATQPSILPPEGKP